MDFLLRRMSNIIERCRITTKINVIKPEQKTDLYQGEWGKRLLNENIWLRQRGNGKNQKMSENSWADKNLSKILNFSACKGMQYCSFSFGKWYTRNYQTAKTSAKIFCRAKKTVLNDRKTNIFRVGYRRNFDDGRWLWWWINWRWSNERSLIKERGNQEDSWIDIWTQRYIQIIKFTCCSSGFFVGQNWWKYRGKSGRC